MIENGEGIVLNKDLKVYLNGVNKDLATLVQNRQKNYESVSISTKCNQSKKISIGIFIPLSKSSKKRLSKSEEIVGLQTKIAADVIIRAINGYTMSVSSNQDTDLIPLPLPFLKDMFGCNGLIHINRKFEEESEKGKREEKSVALKYKKFLEEEKFDIIVGYNSSTACETIAELVANKEVSEDKMIPTLFFNCGSTKVFGEILSEPKYIFRTASHAAADSASLAQSLNYMFPEYKKKKIFALNQNYGWGRSSWRSLMDSLPSENSFYVSMFVEKERKKRFYEEISLLGNSKSDVLYSSFWGGDLINLIESIGECGADFPYINLIENIRKCRVGFPNDLTLILPSGQPIISIINEEFLGIPLEKKPLIIFGGRGNTGELAQANDLNIWFEKAFKEAFDQEQIEVEYTNNKPNYYAYRMAQALLAVFFAYQKAFPDDGSLPSTDKVIEALEGLEYESPSGKISMVLSGGHQAIQETSIACLKVDTDGEYKNKYNTNNIPEEQIIRFEAIDMNPTHNSSIKTNQEVEISPEKCK